MPLDSKQLRMPGAVVAALLGLVPAASGQTWRAEPAPLAVPAFQHWATALENNDGIDFEGRALGEFAANPAGGQRQASAYSGELAFGARIDLGKIAGLDGGSFDILFTDRQGKNLSQNDINNSISTQEIYGGGQTFQLTELTYEQKLLDDKVNVLIGRTLLTNEFAHSELFCEYQNNAVCGQPYLTAADTGVSIYPIAGWGGRVQYWVTPHLYLKAGVYQDVGDNDPGSDHGFTWGLAGTSGFDIPVEIGLQATPPAAAFPDRVDAGVWIDRSHYTPSFSHGQGYYGRTLVYLQGQVRLWQPQAGSPRGLYGFAIGLIGTPAGHLPSNFEINAGLVDQGLFAARPLDYLDFSISDTHASAAELAAIHTSRQEQGSAIRPAANLVMFELNYAAQVTPWLQVTPNFQYILHPDGNGGVLKAPPSNLPNAVVVGLQFVVNIPKLLGIPGSDI